MMFLTDIVDKVDAPYAADLFRKLRDGWYRSLSDAEEIAVDAGMYTSHGNGQGYNTKKWSCTFFHQAGNSNVFRTLVYEGSTHKREGKRHQKTCPQCAEGILIVFCTGLTGHVLGNSSLDTGDGEGERESKYGRNQLIDSHTFRTEYIGQKDSVEEADQAA